MNNRTLVAGAAVGLAAAAGLPTAYAQAPLVTAVTPAPAESPGTIVIHGQNLAGTIGVDVDGKPQGPVSWTPTSVTFPLGPDQPGFRDLTLTHIGSPQTFWPGALELWPSLRLERGGPGTSVVGELDLGGSGFWVLAVAPTAFGAPTAFPGAYWGLQLDPAGLLIVATGAAPSSGIAALDVPVPADAAFIGASLGFQAWTQPTAPGLGGESFTNAVTVAFASSMAILDCTLGCDGDLHLVGCTAATVPANGAIEVTFTEPVNPATLSPLTFKVSTASGAIVPGTLGVDALDPRVARFEPLLTLAADGALGYPLDEGATLLLRVPGTSSNVGPWIVSAAGNANQTQLLCDLTVGPIVDAVPGPPSVAAFAETASGDVPLVGASGVDTDARLRFEFDELMDTADLIELPAGTSPSIAIAVDLDGDLGTLADRVPLAGQFSLAVDQGAPSTTLWFDALGGLPAAGPPGQPVRQIVVDLPATITDLAGTPLTGAGTLVFTTQPGSVDLVLPAGGEDFDDLAAIDGPRTGALIDTTAGRALLGLGGGSGALGDLVVEAGQTVVLSTSSDGAAAFGPGAAFDTYIVDSYDTAGGVLPGTQSVIVGDGLFEFASLRVAPGGTLRLAGDAAARLFVRGDATIEGRLAVDGNDAAAHAAGDLFGGQPGPPGAGAGHGGPGGDRNVLTGSLLTKLDPALAAHDPGAVVSLLGQPGQGRGGASPAGGDDFGAGAGGPAFGPVFPGPSDVDLGSFEANFLCQSAQVGVAGVGATFATLGGDVLHQTPTPSLGVPTIPTLPSPSTSLLRAYEVALDPDRGGVLLAGAGGGGGGTGIADSKSNGTPFNCSSPLLGPSLAFLVYADSSGAAGGSGGGGLQLQVGRRLALSGEVDLSGGAGGGLLPSPSIAGGTATAPGGGGTGGAGLVQAFDLAIDPLAGAIDVSGGAGGLNDANGSRGGDGGAGLVHVQNSAYLAGTPLPTSIVPDDPLTPAGMSDIVLPSTGGVGEPPIADLIALGDFLPGTSGASARSGFQSCWAGAAGAFDLDFEADDPLAGTVGWNAAVDLVDMSGQVFATVDLRGDSGFVTGLTGLTLEELVGSDLGTSPLVIRFQGVRALATYDLVCDETQAALLDGSLTPWVRSPEELEGYWDLVLPNDPALATARRPNLIRYQVIFDSAAPFGELVGGVSALHVNARGY